MRFGVYVTFSCFNLPMEVGGSASVMGTLIFISCRYASTALRISWLRVVRRNWGLFSASSSVSASPLAMEKVMVVCDGSRFVDITCLTLSEKYFNKILALCLTACYTVTHEPNNMKTKKRKKTDTITFSLPRSWVPLIRDGQRIHDADRSSLICTASFDSSG